MRRKNIVLVIVVTIASGWGCQFDSSGLRPPAREVCDDGRDNDGDGLVDCNDTDCATVPVCQPDCGNGVLDASEVCDGGENCLADCTCPGGMTPNGAAGCLNPALCGDGNIDSGEECDDGGESASCDADCTLPACGDGTVNTSAGEFCDDAGESANCDDDCSLPACGDGHLNADAGEECDEAGESASCDADCTLPRCGDGNVNSAAGEVCDDAGESATCNIDCSIPACGDGVLNTSAGEVCDDGNTTGGDGCSADCLSDETCGNGVVDNAAGEVCDDGNTTGGDGCSADCSSNETCGNGTVDPGEDCDGGTDCLQNCLCPEGMGSDGDGCQPDPSTCHDGIDNDQDGDTDCDDTKCGVLTVQLDQGGNVDVVTDADTQTMGVPPGGYVTIDINALDQWGRVYVYGVASAAQNNEGFLYWEDGVDYPAPFGTPGTFATSHSINYGNHRWTNYYISCSPLP